MNDDGRTNERKRRNEINQATATTRAQGHGTRDKKEEAGGNLKNSEQPRRILFLGEFPNTSTSFGGMMNKKTVA